MNSLLSQLKKQKSIKNCKLLFRAHIDTIQFGSDVDENVLEILFYHPEWNSKSLNMERIVKANNQIIPGEFELHVIKTDGSLEDISWRIAIENLRGCKPKKYNNNVRCAARTLIHCEQILEAKRLLGGIQTDHVDHTGDSEFNDLFTQWLNLIGKTESDISIEPIRNYKMGKFYTFVNNELRISWKEYHKANAVIRILDGNEHIRITRLNRINHSKEISQDHSTTIRLHALLNDKPTNHFVFEE